MTFELLSAFSSFPRMRESRFFSLLKTANGAGQHQLLPCQYRSDVLISFVLMRRSRQPEFASVQI